jgi:SAM-dependent methyltransferase
MPSSYDDIAGMYDAFWADWYLPAALPALEKLFFSRVPPNAKILDVCCGSGHVTQELVRRGYQVTGVDGSAALIAIARSRLPGVRFYVQDVQRLQIEGPFEAAISTFDSLNHVLSLAGVQEVFVNVHNRLTAGGVFVFDMNLEDAYTQDLTQWHVTLNDNAVGLVRGHYDPVSKTAATELVWFTRQGETENWLRRKSVVEQRCYPEGEILLALRAAGFSHIEALMAADAGMEPDLALGRIFFVAMT